MTERISLDSELWDESESGRLVQAELRSWKEKSPSVSEFRRAVEINSCSDALYKSFYYALPYFVDELEKNSIKIQSEMITMLYWNLARAFEGDSDQLCADLFDAQSERLMKLLFEMIAGGYTEVLQDNLAAIAALNGDPVLAQAILAICP